MRALVQRVSRAAVRVDGETVGKIDQGLLILLGVARGDGESEVRFLSKKIAELRIFGDRDGKMNLSVEDVGGACLVVSQFTLLADCGRGRRPFFGEAEAPEKATALCQDFVAALQARGLAVGSGRFGAMMDVELVNDGPVTIGLDTAVLRPAGT